MTMPCLHAKSFYILLRSWMKAMNVGRPLTGLKGMMLYVHFVASGPANASFSYEHGKTPI